MRRSPIRYFFIIFILTIFPRYSNAEKPYFADRHSNTPQDSVKILEYSPWRFVFQPDGRVWVWWNLKKHPTVTWDYGAQALLEIARGRGHRLWFGAEYRMAAGFQPKQTITPFDPYYIDTYQIFTWRWAVKPRREFFAHLRRVCFHLVDIHNRGATFWTHAALGFGTISPPEIGEVGLSVRKSRKSRLDGFFSFGPYLHGGPSLILGNRPTWQWESSLYLSWNHLLNRTLILETSTRFDQLLLIQSNHKPYRCRFYLRQSIKAQRDTGCFALFLDRHFYDDYLERWYPVTWRIGLEGQF